MTVNMLVIGFVIYVYLLSECRVSFQVELIHLGSLLADDPLFMWGVHTGMYFCVIPTMRHAWEWLFCPLT
jgi:hypothetical protein